MLLPWGAGRLRRSVLHRSHPGTASSIPFEFIGENSLDQYTTYKLIRVGRVARDVAYLRK
jgi:hypothetical protein